MIDAQFAFELQNGRKRFNKIIKLEDMFSLGIFQLNRIPFHKYVRS